jgi:hypothetical protein
MFGLNDNFRFYHIIAIPLLPPPNRITLDLGEEWQSQIIVEIQWMKKHSAKALIIYIPTKSWGKLVIYYPTFIDANCFSTKGGSYGYFL